MNIWICDDNPTFLEQYSEELSSMPDMGQRCVKLFSGGDELLAYAKAFPAPDVVFLDILMDGKNGIETAEALRAMGIESIIVFLTSTPDYAIEGYTVKAFRYLLKPIKPGTMRELLFDISRELENGSLIISSGKSNVSIPKESITYIERINRKTLIHTCDGEEYEAVSRLDELEQQLDARFTRCHKSYIVNFAYCLKLKAGEIVLNDGTVVSISRVNAPRTRAAFFAFHKRDFF